ncbi:MAG: PEP-CTERM sorting domain-containing protein [Pseudomonadota bacterium]
MNKKLMYVVLGLLISSPALAATVTKVGTNFDVVYDDTKLGLFGGLDLVGNNLFFTPNNFKAESYNGNGLSVTSSTANDIRLIAKGDFRFGSIGLQEFGDYFLLGGGQVSLGGQLRAFDPSSPFATQSSANIFVSPTTPLNLNDGINHDWYGEGKISNSTATIIPGNTGWLSNASTVVISVENILTAFTPANLSGPQGAFIEKKFSGVGMVITSTVPEPETWASLLFGFLLIGFVISRRKN